jgi:hypothetical protein
VAVRTFNEEPGRRHFTIIRARLARTLRDRSITGVALRRPMARPMQVFPSFLTVETVKVAQEFTALDDLDRGIGLDWYRPTTLKA